MSIQGFNYDNIIHKYDYNALDNLPTLGATEEQVAQIEQNKNDIANLTAEDVGADPAGSAAAVQTNLNTHTNNADIHFTVAEREKLEGIAENANNYTHPNSGVAAGTYKSVTVNAQGHVTAGTNPTTLAGYGITDAEAKGSVSSHNTNTSAHNDIRDLITGLTNRLNALADSDDTTLDQMSEVVAYIKSNKSLIDSITTSKVNVADIINNLTTNVSNKPLSAAQGVAIKGLIDALQSELDAHEANKNNPHEVTKAQVGLGNVDNTSDANKPVSTAQATAIADAKKAGTDAQSNLTSHAGNKSNPHEVTLSQLGLTATADELNYVDGVTSAIQTQLDGKMNSTDPTGTGSFSLNRKADTAIGQYSFAEGFDTIASEFYSHAEGYTTTSSGVGSHAEGFNSTSSNFGSHAEGYATTASGIGSHAEGCATTASVDGSHSEGMETTASNFASHAEGKNTTASGECQHVQGKWNITDTTSAHIVGNGSSTSKSNAHTLDWDGNAWYSGDVYVGSTSGTNKDTGSKKLATEEFVQNALQSAGGSDSIQDQNSDIKLKFWSGTQAQYDAITNPDASTIYLVV